MTIGRGDSRMPGFQYTVLKVYVLFRETEVARSAPPLIVRVGVEANFANVGIFEKKSAPKFHHYPWVYCTYVLYACFVLRVPGEGVSRRRVDGGRLLYLARGKLFPEPQYPRRRVASGFDRIIRWR